MFYPLNYGDNEREKKVEGLEDQVNASAGRDASARLSLAPPVLKNLRFLLGAGDQGCDEGSFFWEEIGGDQFSRFFARFLVPSVGVQSGRSHG